MNWLVRSVALMIILWLEVAVAGRLAVELLILFLEKGAALAG